MAGMIKVTALQSVRLFGWMDQPRDIVMWEDLEHRKISWRRLRHEYGFTPLQLKEIQPDKKLWIDRGGVSQEDAPDMSVFPVNPITDLAMDLGELWRQKWPVDTLLKMNITFDQLRECGLTFTIMPFFDLSLNSWCKLGFAHKHAVDLNPGLSFKLFGMPHKELLQILLSFDRNAGSDSMQ